MATVVLAPTYGVGYQAFGTNGLPLNAGLINTYAAGGSTPTATYTTSVGNVANANPIQLGTDGRPPAEIWLIQGTSYKFVLTDSLGNIIKTEDNIPGIDDASAFIGTVPIANGGTAQTTTQAALDGLHSTPYTTTAATALNLDTVSSDYVDIVGTTAIVSVSLAPGRERTLLFQGAVAISSNSVLSMLGATTITTIAGDTMVVRGEAGGVVRAVTFNRGAGFPISMTPVVASLTTNVPISTTGVYVDGPSVTQGSVGSWYASGSIVVSGTAGDIISVKLYDGTTIVDSGIDEAGATGVVCLHLSGVFSSTTGNIRIAAKNSTTTSGNILFNQSGNGKDATVSVMRIG